ncbi:MAG: lipid-A-disaccharide synthase [Fulvivirga sp.]
MKYFLVAGERSGDLHGGNLIDQIKLIDPSAQFEGFGGDNMAKAGMKLQLHYREMAFMGFLEVIQNIFTIKRYLSQCKEQIKSSSADAVILIDYGGFNMKIAKYCKSIGVPVHFYISPKVWAWNQKRAIKLKKYVDFMYVILPFEREFFKKYDWEVEYVGNPVLDAVKNHEVSKPELLDKEYIALLPGSRKQELNNMIPIFKQLVTKTPETNFIVASVDNLDRSFYQSIDMLSNVELFDGSSYDLLANSQAAIVTSGTATLETALWKIPQVVVYKTSKISYAIAKRLIKVSFISLVNLIAGREVVKELIQGDLTVVNLKNQLNLLLQQESRESILDGYDEIIKILDIGSASQNAARLICNHTKKAS